ncbi:MAG: 50S ribosomal protein L30 [Armatimonadota bacterium]|nr:50S ribosomal protein L30 [Armatimonadota bacterium]MDR7438603.1 50S ribosomal protein L30 [Armatimonadota bacterium]MDR7562676.1 50S ribosomal protein L30 [Armatimonadota bacterium]MDR7601761.1 50S ribosomal protein L30 [Armatimonadota bacterium]
MKGRVRIVLKRSLIGTTEDQRAAVRTLGLRRVGQSVVRTWSPGVAGLIRKIHHLVAVEPVEEGEDAATAG